MRPAELPDQYATFVKQFATGQTSIGTLCSLRKMELSVLMRLPAGSLHCLKPVCKATLWPDYLAQVQRLIDEVR